VSKILAQAGTTLADVYDIEGSIVGVDQLEAREVQTVHEMGGTIFSERLSTAILRNTSTAVLQSVAWDVIDTPNIDSFFRILQVTVLTNGIARLANCNVSIRDAGNGREVPLWAWDSNIADPGIDIRIDENGGGPTAGLTLLNGINFLPALQTSANQPQSVGVLTFRGLSNAFGAGTVESFALVTLAFADSRAISSRGLPLPSW